MSRAKLYGLSIDADFDLHDTVDIDVGEPDVRVESLPPVDRWTSAPSGEIRLDFEIEGRPWYTVVELSDGSWNFRAHGVCNFLVSPDLSHVALEMDSRAPLGMDAVMTTGALLSLILYLRGNPVFHGSAVDVGGGAVAFVGHSGQGKSTMATLFCAEGAAVVTDDVLVIDDADTTPRVRRGSRDLRLRPNTRELADTVGGATRRVSADEREVVSPAHTSADLLPVRAIVIPSPHRDGTPLRFERLSSKDATLALLTFPRLLGWRDPRVLSSLFRVAAQTAKHVPVLIGHVPWGPPFPDQITDSLMASLGEARE